MSVLMKYFILWQNFNISSSDLNDFFGGPAFLAWARMGNLHGWVFRPWFIVLVSAHYYFDLAKYIDCIIHLYSLHASTLYAGFRSVMSLSNLLAPLLCWSLSRFTLKPFCKWEACALRYLSSLPFDSDQIRNNKFCNIGIFGDKCVLFDEE